MTHKKEYLFVKTGTGDNDRIIPVMDEDRNFILSLSDGEFIKCSVNDARKLWRMRKFWLLLKNVKNHMSEELSDKYPTTEKILLELKLILGHFEVHTDISGRDIFVATNSISFLNMSESNFKNFVNECRIVILKHFLPDISPEDFDKEFMSLMFD
jgi:hypothetical protein